MTRQSKVLLVAPLLLMLCVVYARAGRHTASRDTTPVYPVLRHDNALYIGCAVDGPMDLPEGRVASCGSDVSFSEADLGASLGTVAAVASAAPTGPLLMEHGAQHVPPGSALFALNHVKPARRLMARTPQGWLMFTPHPVSNAHTLGDTLLWASKSIHGTTLNVRSVSLTSLSGTRRRVVVEAPGDVDALVIPTLAAPIDWGLAPGGGAYDLAFAPPKGAVIHMTYFPETGLLVERLDLEWVTVGVPAYASAALRARLDGLIREAPGTRDSGVQAP